MRNLGLQLEEEVGVEVVIFRFHEVVPGEAVDRLEIVPQGEHLDVDDIADMAIRVNDFLSGMFAAIGIRLIDFKLEFGRVWDGDYARIILADEISPDGCRLWDVKSNEKLDKDRFRQDLGGVEEAYQEVARRLGLLPADDETAVLDFDQHRKKRGK